MLKLAYTMFVMFLVGSLFPSENVAASSSTKIENRVEVNTNGSSSVRIINESGSVKVKVEQNGTSTSQSVKIEDNRFEITGPVTRLTNNQVEVARQLIVLQPSTVNHFKDQNELRVGTNVTVKGTTSNGVLYAEQIKPADKITFSDRMDPLEIREETKERQQKLQDRLSTLRERLKAFLEDMRREIRASR